MVGEHEHWRAEYRVIAPPALPILVGPRAALRPDLFRPMISAPMPGPQLLAKASSAPVLPPSVPCISWKVRVPNNHSMSLPPA